MRSVHVEAFDRLEVGIERQGPGDSFAIHVSQSLALALALALDRHRVVDPNRQRVSAGRARCAVHVLWEADVFSELVIGLGLSASRPLGDKARPLARRVRGL